MSKTHTEEEILSQPQVWAQTLETLDSAVLSKGLAVGQDVIVTGCGSTHYLSMTAASLLRLAGLNAVALPASELLMDASSRPMAAGTALLAISRSGTTTETLMAVDAFRQRGGERVITVTVYGDSPLAEASDVVHVAPDAVEQSVAQTRSFSSMLLIAQAIAATLAGESLSVMAPLPELAAAQLAGSRQSMAQVAADPSASSFYFLASDPLFGVGSEAMLKLKEMSLTHSEAYHAMEFRHGPMSMCDESAVVVGLVSPERANRELAVIDDIRKFTGTVVTLGDRLQHDISARLSPFARPVLYLPALQLLALERALHKGLDPDAPRNLTAVIELDNDRQNNEQGEE